MPYSRDDIEELARYLHEHPEEGAVLRQALFGASEERLTAALSELAEAQAGIDRRLATLTERIDALAERVDDLAAAQAATDRRLEALTERVDQLTERVDELAQQLTGLTQRVDELAQQLAGLADHVSSLAGHVDWLRGDAIERRYRERAGAYLGRIAWRLRLVDFPELDDLLEPAVADGAITGEEADRVRLADAALRGRLPDGDDAYVVVEASVGVELHDVERARERAELLGRVVSEAVVAVVAGEWVNPEAVEAARAMGVWQVTNGRARPPQAA